MTCEELVKGEALEHYVSGQLDEPAQVEVERHVFECEACALRLDDLMTVRSVLAASRTVGPLMLPTRRAPAAWHRQPLAMAAAVATLMFGAAGAIWWTRTDPPPQATAPPPAAQPAEPGAGPARPDGGAARAEATRPAAGPEASPGQAPRQATVDWASLARFEAPAFVALTVRGGEQGAAAPDGLDAAREAYAAGRHADAARLLDEWIAAHGISTEAAFYRGVSRLLSGDLDTGLADLAVVADSSQAPYGVEALLYMAHGRLARRDADGARRALERYIALDGDFSAEARGLLGRLPAPASPAR